MEKREEIANIGDETGDEGQSAKKLNVNARQEGIKGRNMCSDEEDRRVMNNQ